MIRDEKWKPEYDALHDLAMAHEVAVVPMFEQDYLTEFYDFYRIRDRSAKLIPVQAGFDEAMKDLCGEYHWEEIAQKTKGLFGLPRRITAFDNMEKLKDELGGPGGLSSFFFVFDVMFCEYEAQTLCFICGTNN